MRWKILFAFLLLACIAVAGGAGWYKWQTVQIRKELAEQLLLCKNQIRMEEHARAQANLERILAEHPNVQGADAIWATLAASYEKTGDADKAVGCWEKIRTDFPGSPHVDEALAALAHRHFDHEEFGEAERLWDILLKNFQDSDAVDDALFGKARLTYEREGALAARAALLRLHEAHPDSNRRAEVEEMLGKVNLELLYSSALLEEEGDQIYAIRRGDTLESIGRQFGVSPDLLARINHIPDERSLTVGRRLKVPSVEFSITIDKSDNTLLLQNRGRFFKRYRVRTGSADWRTPRGDFHIIRKVKDPSWNNPEDHRTYGPGDPGNELGTRWMAFEGNMLGIHGTIQPETIGTYVSKGCIGMLTEDVEELYDLAPLRTPVKITGKMQVHDKEKI